MRFKQMQGYIVVKKYFGVRCTLSIAFTANRKGEFVPCDQVFHLLIVYCSLYLHKNR